jgi:hypothetical protein
VNVDQTDADRQAWLDERHTHVQGLHANRDAAKAFFESLKKKTS